MHRFEDDVVIRGIGQSAIGRRLGRPALALTVEAAERAMRDAGVTAADVDGVAAYPGGGTSIAPGFSGPSVAEVVGALALRPRYVMGAFEGPAQLGPLVNAALAVSAGLARHVLVYRTVTEGSARHQLRRAAGAPPPTEPPAGPPTGLPTGLPTGPPDRPPTGPPAAAVAAAAVAQHHFSVHGTTRRQLAQVALTARRHAARNPAAVLRAPLSLDDYLAARTIAAPLCLYDCDIHCDGSTALVVSRRSTTERDPRDVLVEAFGIAPATAPSADALGDELPGQRAADQMWGRTTAAPGDVDVAGLYDGFSILTLLWLEALGFCGRGESGPFVEDGRRIDLGGSLPLNTQGGQLSGGRLHGLGFVHELCSQLRGEAGARQVAGARVGVVGLGFVPYVGCALLRSAVA